MTLCSCSERPRCKFYNGWCDNPADGSAMVPLTWKLPLKLGPKFVCKPCWDFYCEAWATPIPGITKPKGADDDWKPSLLDCIRLAEIAIAFEQRDKRPMPVRSFNYERRYDDAARYTTAQLEQVMVLRRYHASRQPDRGQP